MKTQVIPAQITTVEDKIAGNLSFTQIIILVTPILFAVTIYILLPPAMVFGAYKIIISLIVVCLSIISIIRIKGKIILNWALIIGKYNLRPKYYLFNKNTVYAREIYQSPNSNPKPKKLNTPTTHTKQPKPKQVIDLNNFLKKEKFQLVYKTNKKGGLNVAFKKIKK